MKQTLWTIGNDSEFPKYLQNCSSAVSFLQCPAEINLWITVAEKNTGVEPCAVQYAAENAVLGMT